MRKEFEAEGLGVLAVSLSSNKTQVPAYARRHGFHGPVTYFTDEDGLERINLTNVPTTYFVSADGKVLGMAKGGRSKRFFRKKARELLSGEMAEKAAGLGGELKE